MEALRRKLQETPYMKEKIRFLLFALILFLVFFLAKYLLGLAFARYEVRAMINSNIDKALYIFEDEKLSFNLEPEGIIPSNDPYVYKFSVSNFNTTKESDVDISYTIQVRTTTNLPITISMYRNELHTAVGATNIFNGGAQTRQDTDSAWYRLYTTGSAYQMAYTSHVTDIYTMVIDFPATYANNPVYANSIESIEVTINSQQII